ncbi:hypothetical protein DPMN_120305 [Dreissena polymorpha]|uniref:Uncharacterized protein n=1 Tax=Dreissena polymorpha TaxID=45954 RepID=A0A9D4JRZ2_DREPO|nr:hypothetical protein DPMN_120305 [Dreissena polymorpha]
MRCPPSDREFVGLLPTLGAISLSPPQTPSTGSSQETDSTMSTSAYNRPSCNSQQLTVGSTKKKLTLNCYQASEFNEPGHRKRAV